MARGSGIPELKGYLNGNRQQGLFQWKTFFWRATGVCLVITATMPFGREGPSVHIGACVASAALNVFSRSNAIGARSNESGNTRFGRGFSHGVFRGFFSGWRPSPEERRQVLQLGSAAGVAAAFNAPIGGLLYVMEEVASDLPVDYVWRAIMACGVSVGVAQILYAADVGEVDYASLVISGPDSSTGWKLEDLPLVVVLAACAGAASAAFTRAADWFGNQRRTGFASLVRDPETSRLVRFATSRLGQFLDAILGAAVLATCQMVLPAFFSCRAAPSAVFDEDAAGTSAYALENGAGGAHGGALFEESPPSRRRGLLSSAIYVPRTFVQYTCAEGEFSEMATLMLQNEEGVVKHLFARDELYSEPLFTAPVVAAFLAYFFVIASVTFGGAFPAGVFIPNMLMGATLGRLFGFLAERVNPGANKGTYALIGSAAMLSGFTRMTAAVVVIIIEATASLDVLAPIILACVVSRAVASALVGHSLDERLIVAKGVPFLEREPHPSAALVRVGEALGEADTRRGPVIAFRPQERLEVLLNAVLLTEHNAFPVLEDVERNERVVGLVTRAMLQRAPDGLEEAEAEAVDDASPRRLPRNPRRTGTACRKRARNDAATSSRAGFATRRNDATETASTRSGAVLRTRDRRTKGKFENDARFKRATPTRTTNAANRSGVSNDPLYGCFFNGRRDDLKTSHDATPNDQQKERSGIHSVSARRRCRRRRGRDADSEPRGDANHFDELKENRARDRDGPMMVLAAAAPMADLTHAVDKVPWTRSHARARARALRAAGRVHLCVVDDNGRAGRGHQHDHT